ncbi:MAG: microcystin degradation protein MlrC [Planctomycetaceae bacterium]|jgi:microcystin degradation protein MlrC|nr:microcystin degradation protein MlrC [Planctomycetaceae bacterium]MDP7278207.1 M81 family metallopeptidase [Planctomycetaceae bacterium]
MPKRILVAEFKQETSSFNPQLTRYADFHQLHGEELLAARRGTQTEIAGALQVFDDSPIDVIPVGGMAAWAVSGGPICEPDLQRLTDEFCAAVEAHRDVDAVLFCLHGAMAGEREGDPEGRMLARARELLGHDKPLVISLDLHAILTFQMTLCAPVVVPFHTYPHVDYFETGQRAAGILLRLLEGDIAPTTSMTALPMLVRGDELLTESGLLGDAIRVCRELEDSEKGLSAGVFIGNPFTDVPGLGSWAMACTDGDQDLADQTSRDVARFLWEHRHRLVADLVSLDESIAIANASEGLCVFSDAADATASGASGDSNAILAGLLGSDPSVSTPFQGKALLSIVDAPAAQLACGTPVGNTVQLSLGGTRDPDRFTPLPVTATVLSTHEGEFVYENGKPESAGATAVLRMTTPHGEVDALVTQRSVYVVGRNVYTAHGLDPVDYDLVVAKSPNGFRTHYESIATTIVPVDVPGSTSANLKSLPYSRCPRPIFPLDEDVPAPILD